MIVGASSGIKVSFKVIWDYENFYVAVCAEDETPNASDQIEIAYEAGGERNYLLANFSGSYTESKGTNLMTSKYLGGVESEGKYYFITRHTLADKEALKENAKLLINVNYWDYADGRDRCRYSWSSHGAGNPQDTITLTGTPDVISEKEKADIAAAEAVKTLIAALPANVTLADEEAVYNAKAEYEKLTADQKALISQRIVDSLDECVDALNELKENKAAADAVIAKIEAVGDVTLEKESAISEARTAYNALTSAQKKLIEADTLATLTDAETALAVLKTAAQNKAAADAVIAKIEAIGEVTLEKESAITEARTAYNVLTAEQKELITEAQLKVLTDAETALNALKNPANPYPDDGDKDPDDTKPAESGKKKKCGSIATAAGLPIAILMLVFICAALGLRKKRSANNS